MRPCGHCNDDCELAGEQSATVALFRSLLTCYENLQSTNSVVVVQCPLQPKQNPLTSQYTARSWIVALSNALSRPARPAAAIADPVAVAQ